MTCNVDQEIYENNWPGLTLRKLMGKVDIFPGQFWNPGGMGGCIKPDKEEDKSWNNPQTAFLGPQLWDKKLSISNFEQDVSWDNYRGWNHNQVNCQGNGFMNENQAGYRNNYLNHWNQQKQEELPPKKVDDADVEFKVSDEDLSLAMVPGAEFDPKTRCFSSEELKPQPIIKKRPKIFTPINEKDDRYWEKRAKNNAAARRSREARRLKENQIALRAAYLEKQNKHLKITLKNLNLENANMKVNVDHLLARIREKENQAKSSPSPQK